jgi:hypothetical protein
MVPLFRYRQTASRQLDVRLLDIAREREPSSLVRDGELHGRPPVLVNQPKDRRFRIRAGSIGRIQIDRSPHPALVVDDLERVATEHRSIDIRPDPNALRADMDPHLRQQKSEKPEIDDSENDK